MKIKLTVTFGLMDTTIKKVLVRLWKNYLKIYNAIYVNGIITFITAITPIIIKTRNNNKNTINCVGEVFFLILPSRWNIKPKNLIFFYINLFQLINILYSFSLKLKKHLLYHKPLDQKKY